MRRSEKDCMSVKPKYYHVLNYGCQMNESDSEHYEG